MKNGDFIERAITPKITELLRGFPVITLTGPRQSGKTTLCRRAFPQFAYFNLEDEATRGIVGRGAREFLENASAGGGAIIDEAQRVPEIFSAAQLLVDEKPSRRLILSGSSNFLLMKNVTQSLAGRAAVMKLLPFSLAELGAARTRTASADELIFRGGYPRVWTGTADVFDVFSGYTETYVERDVRRLEEIRNLSAFRNFIRLCAGSVGCEFNATSFADALGVSVPTIQNWLSLLEASYVVFRIEPLFANVRKRLAKRPKLYFCDTGLACRELEIETPTQLATHPARGRLFENLVVLEFLKRRFAVGKDAAGLNFYRDGAQREVDLTERRAGKLYAYEIKAAAVVRDDFFRTLDYFRKLFREEVASTQVVCDSRAELPVAENGVVNFRNL